jgi:prepilin-type N-terminal cleavage/methylation domain-containing protein
MWYTYGKSNAKVEIHKSIHNKMQNKIKGFTLIELLIVIAIIAILAVAVILTLNPAELLRQSRDSTRVSDMATLKSAIALYLADVSTPALATSTSVQNPSLAPYGECYVSTPAGSNSANGTSTCAIFGLSGTGLNGNYINVASTTGPNQRKIDAYGWLPINFNAISSGAPFGTLPLDPVNNGNYFYAYAATSTLTYKIEARLESNKYNTAPNNIGATANDGGTNADPSWYETGTNLSL